MSSSNPSLTLSFLSREFSAESQDVSLIQARWGPGWFSGRSFCLVNILNVIFVGVVWLSFAVFGMYIVLLYGTSSMQGEMSKWNTILPLWDPEQRLGRFSRDLVGLVAIGLHFVFGACLLFLEFFQLLPNVRRNHLPWHRCVGRFYVCASLLTATGGLLFIFLKGTVGGTAMDIGFALYGAFIVICALQTMRFARLHEIDTHRTWALRLFALVLGSWLYRLEYGLWGILTNGAGHTNDFQGPFDMVMNFLFYMSNKSTEVVP